MAISKEDYEVKPRTIILKTVSMSKNEYKDIFSRILDIGMDHATSIMTIEVKIKEKE